MGSDVDGALVKLDNIKEVLSFPSRSSIKYIDLRFKDIVVKRT